MTLLTFPFPTCSHLTGSRGFESLNGKRLAFRERDSGPVSQRDLGLCYCTWKWALLSLHGLLKDVAPTEQKRHLGATRHSVEFKVLLASFPFWSMMEIIISMSQLSSVLYILFNCFQRRWICGCKFWNHLRRYLKRRPFLTVLGTQKMITVKIITTKTTINVL